MGADHKMDVWALRAEDPALVPTDLMWRARAMVPVSDCVGDGGGDGRRDGRHYYQHHPRRLHHQDITTMRIP